VAAALNVKDCKRNVEQNIDADQQKSCI